MACGYVIGGDELSAEQNRRMERCPLSLFL
jgi:hypothetical protein